MRGDKTDKAKLPDYIGVIVIDLTAGYRENAFALHRAGRLFSFSALARRTAAASNTAVTAAASHIQTVPALRFALAAGLNRWRKSPAKWWSWSAPPVCLVYGRYPHRRSAVSYRSDLYRVGIAAARGRVKVPTRRRGNSLHPTRARCRCTRRSFLPSRTSVSDYEPRRHYSPRHNSHRGGKISAVPFCRIQENASQNPRLPARRRVLRCIQNRFSGILSALISSQSSTRIFRQSFPRYGTQFPAGRRAVAGIPRIFCRIHNRIKRRLAAEACLSILSILAGRFSAERLITVDL